MAAVEGSGVLQVGSRVRSGAAEMGVIRLYMTTSLDGYVVGPKDSVDAPMGVGGFRLFNWLDHRFAPGRTARCSPS